MTLNTPFSDVMPALPADRYAALKADIEQAGLIKSIVVDESDNIIDGHHRYKACLELGIEIKTEACVGIGDDRDKRLRIIALNLAERDLSAEERRRLDAERKRSALELLAEGRGIREVARLVGKPPTSIHRWRESMGVPTEQSAQTNADAAESSPNITNKTSKSVNMTADEQKAKALELLKSGVRYADIAAAVRAHPNTIKRWEGSPDTQASTRGRGGGRSRKFEDSDVERLFHAGKSRAEICAELGISPNTASAYLKRLGLSRAGKRAQNQLVEHTSLAIAQADAWTIGSDRIAATASVSSADHIAELISALNSLSRAVSTLKVRLNKEAGKKE